jgi:hypothetical protein
MIRSNLNRCRFEILEIINRLERAHLSQSRIASSVGVGGGRGSWDVVGASQRGRVRKPNKQYNGGGVSKRQKVCDFMTQAAGGATIDNNQQKLGTFA